MGWRDHLDQIAARGELVVNVGGLPGLAAARAAHEGQFFTPAPVADLLWHLLGEATQPRQTAHHPRRCRIIDTAAGTGRLLARCTPDDHEIWGIEVDPDCAGPLARAHTDAGFTGSILHGRLEEHHPAGFDVALINPPFSLHWDSPTLSPYPSNSHGRYGPRSAAQSQWYALAQACAAARVVGAIVPRQVADTLLAPPCSDGRNDLRALLRAVVHLPATAFRDAGAEVATSILILSDSTAQRHAGVRVTTVSTLDCAPVAPLAWHVLPSARSIEAHVHHVDVLLTAPAITRPVTGDARVHIGHCGRRIILGFHCGAREAIVRNRILVSRLPRRLDSGTATLPRSVVYDGQGRLDLEVHLAQADPVASFLRLVADITATGAQVQVDHGILPYLRRRARRMAREQIPLRRWAWLPTGDIDGWLRGQATVTVAATGRTAIGGRVLAAGEQIILERSMVAGSADPRWHATGGGSLPHALLQRAFRVLNAPEDGWRLLHPGLREHAPEAWQAARRRAVAAGIDRFLTRGYQFDDLVELISRGRGICGWFMALGKARLALALALMGGRHNLIIVEARLITEMRHEIAAIGLPDDQWQEITQPADCAQLRKINLISYTRLKMPLGGYNAAYPSRDTIARRLRHRISVLVADEAHSLRNQGSDQTRACLQVAPKRAFDLSGTPIANYPRDILPLLRHCQGDGTVSQPYGQHHPLLTQEQHRTMRGSRCGNEAFADLFCTLEWVTNEFMDGLQEGAKREIPRIADVPAFRRLVAPAVMRRVPHEPEVAAHIRIPTPTIIDTEIPWDDEHLEHYVAITRQFRNWYEHHKRITGRGPSLAVTLAKIGAVVHAANHPQDHKEGPSTYTGGWTAKQRACLDRGEQWAGEGHHTIIFLHHPRLVDAFAAEFERRGISCVRMHGGIPIATRMRELDTRFRAGTAQVLVATYGTCQQGLNLHQADRVIQYSRDWTASAESQAIHRPLRPQQQRPVVVERMHHAGSIDVYQAQMVAFKAGALSAGLDYGEDDPSAEFLHYETILHRFVEDFERLTGRKVA